jgi:hypothetical protein
MGWTVNTLQAVQDLILACPQATTMGLNTNNFFWQDSRNAQTVPHALLKIDSGTDSEDDAQRITRHADTVSVYVCWNPGDGTGNSPAVTALTAFDSLMDEIAARIGTGTYLVRATRAWEAPSRLPDDHSFRGSWDFVITFSWDI